MSGSGTATGQGQGMGADTFRGDDVLARILDTKRSEVAAGRAVQSLAELQARVADLAPTRGFAERIAQHAEAGAAVIAEVKRASPSAGLIRADFDPAAIARSYEAGGAACLSVLTDRPYFQGANEFLGEARSACSLPALRKEFIVDEWQIAESRVLGADCILLIVAALGHDQLQHFAGVAAEAGLDVLVEVHDEDELERALTTDARLIGVNNRDLRTFTTDLAVSERLRAGIPASRIMVTESGIHTRDDVERLLRGGIRAFLVGEAFMRADDPGAALQSLFMLE
ncbi:indole-3-glycerol phosphate synthase TrpC [Elongatibacter sediminis]|uniref:indole-3-glycerol phosphate synthase TrpC n=1 Tax=Elongatibacter sediminis TaxID=3119006 RepID=UPI003F4C90FE